MPRMRAVTKSLAHALPFTSAQTKQGIDEGLARILVGLQSQVYGLDEKGEVNPAAWITGGESRRDMLERISGKRKTDKDEYSLPGALNTLLALPAVLPERFVPERSKRAQHRQMKLLQMLRVRAALGEPHGFKEMALESAGEMLGQIPLPGMGAAKKVPRTAVKRVLGAVPEYLSPTIRPSGGNYAAGTLAGGVLRTLGEDSEEPSAAYADGGRATVLDKALEQLQKIMGGGQVSTKSIERLLEGLRDVSNVPPSAREELDVLKNLRDFGGYPPGSGAGRAATERMNQQMLEKLAEIYLTRSDLVRMRAGGGRI